MDGSRPRQNVQRQGARKQAVHSTVEESSQTVEANRAGNANPKAVREYRSTQLCPLRCDGLQIWCFQQTSEILADCASDLSGPEEVESPANFESFQEIHRGWKLLFILKNYF